jgi:hypothetical protein
MAALGGFRTSGALVGHGPLLYRDLLPGADSMSQLCLDERDHVVRLGVAPDHRFREHERAIDVHVEDSVRARYDLHRDNVVLVLFEQSSHQTGGFRPRPSGDAVLDPNPVVGHPAILTGSRPPRDGFYIATHWSADAEGGRRHPVRAPYRCQVLRTRGPTGLDGGDSLTVLTTRQRRPLAPSGALCTP